jgi:hypothetical protein
VKNAPGRLAALAALAVVVLALVPVLRTPHVSDDVVNYSIGWLSGEDFARAAYEEVRQFALSAGRVFVLAAGLKNVVFSAFDGLAAYKLFLVATNIACAAALFLYARVVGASRVLAVIALLALPLLFQLRDFHDPLVSFNGMLQISAALVFISLALHARWHRTRDGRFLLGAWLAFVADLFLYEVAAIAAVLVLAQDRALGAGGRGRYRAGIVFMATVVAYAGVVAAMRWIGAHYFGMGHSLYNAAFSPAGAMMTFAKQMLAVVPFSYVLLRPGDGNWGIHALPDPAPWPAYWHFYVALVLFIALDWIAMRLALRRDERAEPLEPQVNGIVCSANGVRALAWVAAGLMLLPAILLSFIGRYQNTFAAGNGYVFVYYQELGAALALACLAFELLRRRPVVRTATMAGIALAVGLASAGNLVDNLAVAAKLSRAWSGQYPWRAMLRSAQFRGACRDVPVAVSDFKPWNEYRVVGNAGFRFLRGEDPVPPSSEICVARSVAIDGREGAAFAKVRTAANGTAPRFASRIHLVFAGDGRDEELRVGCRADSLRTMAAADWTQAGRRYVDFVVQGTDSDISKDGRGFALPCEQAPASAKGAR